MNLIGLCGYAGVGKDEAAKALVREGWCRVAFADAVRDAALAVDPIVSDQRVFDRKGNLDPHRLSYEVETFGWQEAKHHPEVRRLLQRLGTEAGRNIHGEDCWTKIAFRKARERLREGAAGVVFTDCRFPNEADEIRRRGGRVVRIDRPGVGPINEHISDTGIIDIQPDAVIVNDGTIDDLHRAILMFAKTAGAMAT